MSINTFKKVILMRHAHAENESIDIDDCARKLTTRGKSQAKNAVEKIQSLQIQIDKVLGSSAIRVQETIKVFEELGLVSSQNIQLCKSMYICTTEQMINNLLSLSDDIQTVAIVNHNPAVTDIVYTLMPSYYKGALPTAGFVVLKFNTACWSSLLTANHELICTDYSNNEI
jgi:phosphohistidine phosphatase